MFDLISTTSAVTFKNKTLNSTTVKILSLAEDMRKSALETAFLMSMIAESKVYLEDGFKSANEWAEKTFGLQKSQSYNLIKVGKEWTIPLRNDKGRVIGYASKLYQYTDMKHGDFNSTQLIVLSVLDFQTVADWVKSGKISPLTSCADLRKLVTETKKGKTESAETEGAETEGTETEGGKVVEVQYQTITLKDERGYLYEIPIKVAEKYKVASKVTSSGETVKTVGGKPQKSETETQKTETQPQKTQTAPQTVKKTERKTSRK